MGAITFQIIGICLSDILFKLTAKIWKRPRPFERGVKRGPHRWIPLSKVQVVWKAFSCHNVSMGIELLKYRLKKLALRYFATGDNYNDKRMKIIHIQCMCTCVICNIYEEVTMVWFFFFTAGSTHLPQPFDLWPFGLRRVGISRGGHPLKLCCWSLYHGTWWQDQGWYL